MQLRKEIKRGDFMSDITAVIDTLSDVADVLPTSGETRSMWLCLWLLLCYIQLLVW